jgi:Glyoxalase-like domain
VTGDPAEPIARFAGVSLDCADPATLADFYLQLLGGQVLWRSAGSAGLRVPGVVLVMQRVAEYRPPAWPGSSVVHLDLTAGDGVAAAAARAVEAGAVLAEYQPDPRWRVLLDPAGHPFCITTITPPAT